MAKKSISTKKLAHLIDEKIKYYNNLAETKNGFEMACKGGVEAMKDLKKELGL
jgi:hypothetical protein